MTDMSATGSCLCGAVRYRVAGELRDVWQCHCVRCQKTSGNFVAATRAPDHEIEVTDADGALEWYRPDDDPNVAYGFCRACGSSLFWRTLDSTAENGENGEGGMAENGERGVAGNGAGGVGQNGERSVAENGERDAAWSIMAGTLDTAPPLRTTQAWFADHAAAHTILPGGIEHIPSNETD